MGIFFSIKNKSSGEFFFVIIAEFFYFVTVGFCHLFFTKSLLIVCCFDLFRVKDEEIP